jgi:hypothetical protein
MKSTASGVEGDSGGARGRRSKSRDSRPAAIEHTEVSCGWCKISLRDIEGSTANGADLDITLPLQGGTPTAPIDIKQDDVLQRRSGYVCR